MDKTPDSLIFPDDVPFYPLCKVSGESDKKSKYRYLDKKSNF
jgi:hypothetical protein